MSVRAIDMGGKMDGVEAWRRSTELLREAHRHMDGADAQIRQYATEPPGDLIRRLSLLAGTVDEIADECARYYGERLGEQKRGEL